MFENKPKLRKNYRKITYKEDPRRQLILPECVLEDLVKMAEYNGRDLRSEMVARLIASLVHNDYMMVHDRLQQLIWNDNLAIEKK